MVKFDRIEQTRRKRLVKLSLRGGIGCIGCSAEHVLERSALPTLTTRLGSWAHSNKASLK